MKPGEHDQEAGFQGPLRGRQAQDQDRFCCPRCGWHAPVMEPWLIASADTGWQYVVALVAVEKGD